MHELSIAQSIIQIVENSLPNKNENKVNSVHLLIGKLSGIEIDALQFAYSVLKNNTFLNNSELKIEITNGQAKCLTCNTSFEMNKYGIPCPECGGYVIEILQGKEMKVLKINIDD